MAGPMVRFPGQTTNIEQLLGNFLVGASLSEEATEEITVEFTITGTATIGIAGDPGVDVEVPGSSTTGILTFAPGSRNAFTGTLRFQDDFDVEPDETLVLELTQVLSGEATIDQDNKTHTFTILDDDAVGFIRGLVWYDQDRDGIDDDTGLEFSLGGVVVDLLNADGTPTGLSATSDVNGRYEFDALAPGDYRLQFAHPDAALGLNHTIRNAGDGTNDSDPDPATGITDVFSIAAGQIVDTIDAGFVFDNVGPAVSGLDPLIVFSTNAFAGGPQVLDDDQEYEISRFFNIIGFSEDRVLKITVTGLLPEDSVSLKSVGDGVGQLKVVQDIAGARFVFLGGDRMGRIDETTNGDNGKAFEIIFDTFDGKKEHVEAVLNSLTFDNSAGSPTNLRTLTIAVDDGSGGIAQNEMMVVIGTPPNFDPVAVNDGFTTELRTPLSGNLFDDNGNGPDSDLNGDPFTVTSFEYLGAGTLDVQPDGSFDYTAPFGFSGPDTFTYTIDDGEGGTDTATVDITVVHPLNMLPFGGNLYSIAPPHDGQLGLRETAGTIEVFVIDPAYFDNAPPGTTDQPFVIMIDDGVSPPAVFNDAVFVGHPDVAPVTAIALSSSNIAENSDAGAIVGQVLLTFDDAPNIDEDFLVELSGDDAQLFIHDADGNLIVADDDNLDFETRQTANVTLTATNLNGVQFAQDLEITIENRPISDITLLSGGTVRENAAADTVIATFEAFENPVEPTAVLSIVAGGDGQFYLDGNELKVSPGATFDFDDQSNYFITFSATDGNGPAYEESFDIFVENVGPILGTPDEDVLDGTGFSDEIQALESDDIINASNGDDDIDGGPGTDTVVYARGRNQITHDWQNDGTIVVTRTALGEGTDTLTNVERIDLDDGSLLYDVGTPNLGFGYRIYQASFDRTPDEGGVLFWIGVLDELDNQGWSQYEKEQFLASQFIQSDEFKALFGANPTNEQYIDAMYQNVLDRLPDQGGYDFWVGGMVNDGLTREDILIAFTKSDENVDRTAPDLDDGVWVV